MNRGKLCEIPIHRGTSRFGSRSYRGPAPTLGGFFVGATLVVALLSVDFPKSTERSRMAESNDGRSHGRRTFFQEAFAKLVQPVAEYLDTQIGPHLPAEKVLLRPPGALPESVFLETCLRCGNCVDSCPADAIQPLQSDQPNLAETPYIDPDDQPCVVCDTLECMQVCPSGALQKLSVHEIQIGLAEVNYDICLRSSGVDCLECVESCPIGEKAIRLDSEKRVEVLSVGCIGCGVCQYQCPTTPKSIVIRPIQEYTEEQKD